MFSPHPFKSPSAMPMGLKLMVDRNGLTRVWDMILKEDFNAKHIGELTDMERMQFQRVMMLVVSAYSADRTDNFAGTA